MPRCDHTYFFQACRNNMPLISASLTANAAVRYFLKKVTGDYGEAFLDRTPKGKLLWDKVKKEFDNKCAYCKTKPFQLEKEHLIGANKQECGLDHIGNIVPCCSSCNSRITKDKKQVSWKKQLKEICAENNVNGTERVRRENRILLHVKNYNYPKISTSQKKLIKTIAENLYEQTLKQQNDLLKLYDDLKKTPKKPNPA